MTNPNPNVIDVTDTTFGTVVLEESRRRPVVVDFWAEWCQPCRLIGPVLERLSGEEEGRFLLAKLDVDANPQVATAFRVQSIPAVMAFREGRLVNEFVGAIPEQSIRQFLRTVLPTQADVLTLQAEEAERAARVDEAESLFRRAFELDPKHRGAAIGLGRVAASRGDLEAARRLLQPLRPDPEAERLLAAIDISEWSAEAGQSDGQGPLAAAERSAAEGRFDEALAAFLDEVASGGEARDQAKEAMLKLFSVLGEDDPLTREYRRRLAQALF